MVLSWSTPIRINGNMNQLKHHPPTLAPQSKLKFVAIMSIQLAKNPQEVGHSLTHVCTWVHLCGL